MCLKVMHNNSVFAIKPVLAILFKNTCSQYYLYLIIFINLLSKKPQP